MDWVLIIAALVSGVLLLRACILAYALVGSSEGVALEFSGKRCHRLGPEVPNNRLSPSLKVKPLSAFLAAQLLPRAFRAKTLSARATGPIVSFALYFAFHKFCDASLREKESLLHANIKYTMRTVTGGRGERIVELIRGGQHTERIGKKRQVAL